jgi:hypothetical protein
MAKNLPQPSNFGRGYRREPGRSARWLPNLRLLLSLALLAGVAVDECVSVSENTRPIVGFAELEISQKPCRATGVHRGGELVAGRGIGGLNRRSGAVSHFCVRLEQGSSGTGKNTNL